MSNRIHPPEWPSPRGPWPEVSSVDEIHDHGWRWCVNAAGHPDRDGGYPDPQRHVPWRECHSQATFLDGVCRDLDGEPVGVSVYNAAPFHFGQPRHSTPPAPPRVVLETWTNDEEVSQRLSLTPREALRLARILVRCADDLTFVHRAA